MANLNDTITDGSAKFKVVKAITNADLETIYNAWLPSTMYNIGDIAYVQSLAYRTCKKLVCVKAGTSGTTLALSNTDEGAYITDGTCAWVIDSFADGNYTAAHGNGIYRGADITAYFNSGLMSTNIATGNFVGMHIGDYIIKSITIDETIYSDVKWIIGDLDYHLHRGNSEITTHHVMVFPEGVFGYHRMNETDTTEGGYVGSEMWTVTIPKYVTGIRNAFGESHVLNHRELLTTSVDMTIPSKGWPKQIGMADNWVWTTVTVNIFNEAMIYGTTPFGSSGYDVGECNTQVAAMRLNKSLSFSRSGWFWLRAVSTGARFACANYDGAARSAVYPSSLSGHIRFYFLLT